MASHSGSILYTVGHSTRTLQEFISLLNAHGIAVLADVRRYPRSRRFPHFNDDALARSLPAAGIAYRSFQSLGGRRQPSRDSINLGWKSESFRAYADFMQTPAFDEALQQLIAEAQRSRTAIMCAEAVPWRCHRQLIADALLARGWHVLDIYDTGDPKPHQLTSFAVVSGHHVTYPPNAQQATLFE